MPKTKPKPRIFNLALVPPPRGKFTAEKARAWLDDRAGKYACLLQTGFQGSDPRKIEEGDAKAHYSLAYDVTEMSRACAAAIAGEPVRFRRGDCIPDAATATLTIIAMELTGPLEERIDMTVDVCRELALEAVERLREDEESAWERILSTEAERDEARAQLEAMTAERDRLHKYRMRLNELLLNDASNVEERLLSVLSYQNRHELALREGGHDAA